MNLKELMLQSNQLVQQEGRTLEELLKKNQFPSTADEIVQLIQNHQELIEEPSSEDYTSLANALSKRRPVSLQATFAAISHILMPQQFPLKSLDNFKSNLQSVKNNQKEIPMAESEELSQEDIEALLAGNLSEKKTQKVSPEDQISNDDINNLLASMDSLPGGNKKEDLSKGEIKSLFAEVNSGNKKPPVPASPNKEEEFSQDEIEALLSGNSAKNSPPPSKAKDSATSDEKMNALLSADIQGEESEQISEDDIQSLLEAQVAQDNTNPLVQILNSDKQKVVIPKKASSNTEKLLASNIGTNVAPSNADSTSFETKIPQDVFPSIPSIEDLLLENSRENEALLAKIDAPLDLAADGMEEKLEPPNSKSLSKTNIETTAKEIAKVSAKQQNKSKVETNDLLTGGDVRERILSDVYALYVNKGGKPTLQTECGTREDIQKAYIQAMQSFPQNSLFIEKISRKEIIVIKESKEIINLKVNITFE